MVLAGYKTSILSYGLVIYRILLDIFLGANEFNSLLIDNLTIQPCEFSLDWKRKDLYNAS
jgi:hypothetical protein